MWCPVNPRNEATENRDLLDYFDCTCLIFHSRTPPPRKKRPGTAGTTPVTARIGLPDDKWGERVTAVIQLRAAQSVTSDEVRAFAKERIGSVKAPKQGEVWPDLPRSKVGKVGKVLKPDIKARLRRLIKQRYVTASATLAQVSFGWEIPSTGGNPMDFTITNYWLQARR